MKIFLPVRNWLKCIPLQQPLPLLLPLPLRRLLLPLLLVFINYNHAGGQSANMLTLDSCYTLARINYPNVKQLDIVKQTASYSLENASKGYLPVILLAGQASYQSDVTEFPSPVPGQGGPLLSKDQYRVYGEISQSLTDPFTIRYQKDLIRSKQFADEQQVEVELQALKERVNQIFFGILLLDARIGQNDLLRKDIQATLDKTNAAIQLGTVYKGSADILRAEMLKVQQQRIELKATRKGYADALALLVHRTIDETTQLGIPVTETGITTINRPELKLLDERYRNLEFQKKLSGTKNIPRAGIFFQGGYGRPALNMLKDEFELYYIGGFRFTWNLSGFYTLSKEKKLLSLDQQTVGNQKETFLLNTNFSLARQEAEIQKYRDLIDTDNEIVALRSKIRNTANAQLENGIISALDFVAFLNSEDQARQNLLLHRVQLMMAKYEYQVTMGN